MSATRALREPKLTVEEIEPRLESAPRTEIEFAITAEMVAAFASLTGDRSSLHMDEDFASRSVYRRRIAHGMLPIAFLAACQGFQVEDRRAHIRALRGHFIAPAFIGDCLRVVSIQDQRGSEADESKFRFRIENVATGNALTEGAFTVTYSSGAEESAPVGGTASRSESLPAEALEMSRLELTEIEKGDERAFDFRVSDQSIEAFVALLAMGISEGVLVDSTLSERVDLAGLMASLLFTTYVGMCIPGEAATFVEFESEQQEPISTGATYSLVGRVAHVSRAARVVKADLSVSAVDSASEPAVTGRVVTLVNEPVPARRTLDELRAASTDLGLRGKVVLVTGATGGIGETVAKLFALFGSRVAVNYRRNQADAERIVREITDAGGSAIAAQADVSDPDEVAAMMSNIIDELGAVDVLVNNAVRDFRSIAYEDLSWAEIQADLDVAVRGAFNCCKAVTSHMIGRQSGKIVNISSVYADDPPPDQLKYVVSKAALEGLTRALAAELAAHNIQVNAVVPSYVETDTVSQMHERISKKRAQFSPMKRNAVPEEVAQAVLFLASSFASYTTGQRLLVTGGGAPYL